MIWNSRRSGPVIHLRVTEALNRRAAIHATWIPGDKVEAIADLGGHYPTTRLGEDVDPGRTRASKVEEEWTNLVRLVGGRQEGHGKVDRRTIWGQIVAWHGDGGAEELWVATCDRVSHWAALPIDGAARDEAGRWTRGFTDQVTTGTGCQCDGEECDDRETSAALCDRAHRWPPLCLASLFSCSRTPQPPEATGAWSALGSALDQLQPLVVPQVMHL